MKNLKVYFTGDDDSIDYLDINNDYIINKDNLLQNDYDIIWNILTESYKNIGGLKSYRSKKDFINKIKNFHLLKLVFYNDEIIACSTYRVFEDNSNKLVAIGGIKNEIGKKGVQEIIKDDIKQLDLHFWAEVSGKIEYYFKKYNGYPMPNFKASEILGLDNSKIQLSNKDNVHYSRIIGNTDEYFEKMIFGVKNEEIFEEILNEIDDYAQFRKEVNNLTNINEKYDLSEKIKDSLKLINNIYILHEDYNINELLPSWYKALKISKNILLNNITSKTKQYKKYIKMVDYIFNEMPVIKLHKLILN